MSEGKLRLAFGIQQELAELETDLVAGAISHAEASAKLEDSLEYTRECMAWCIENMDADKRAAIACSKIAGVAGRLLHDYIPLQELRLWREAGMKAARLGNTVDEEVAHLTNLSFLNFANNEPQAALELSAQAVALARQIDDRDIYATTLQNQAIILSQTGAIDTALEGLREAETIYNQSDNRSGQAKVLASQALCFSALGNSDVAVQLLRRAIALEKDDVAVGTYLANIADELIGSGDLTEAKHVISKADQIATDSKSKTLVGLVNLRWARWKALRDDEESHKQAIRHLEIALVNFSEMNEAHHILQTLQMQEQTFHALASPDYDYYSAENHSIGLHGLCSVLYAEGKYGEALQASAQLYATGVETENTRDQLLGAVLASRCALALKDRSTAIKYASIGKQVVAESSSILGTSAYSKEEIELRNILKEANALNNAIDLHK